ncbi:MAG: hypothetical protein IPJ65_30655 [Archangiaceae bacterium]|nr:hypothetical protein [Archangiaceae bacterium]
MAPPVVQSARAPIARSLAPMTRSAEVSGDLAALEVEVPPAPKRPRPPARPLAPMASSAEVLEVKQALAEVSRDRFEAALARVRALSARFPQSLLATEAQTVEVLALCGLQRRDEAEALAQALRRRDPLNPSLRRLDASCVGQRK